MPFPAGFCNLGSTVVGLKVCAAYYFSGNFTGARVDGYGANVAVGTVELAQGLERALALANARGYGLLVWDAYRPARAVRRFAQWADEPEDMRTKARHYPNVDKTRLFELGYIAHSSGHSRGSTVDLTLIGPDGAPLDMGTCFDYMDDASHHDSPLVSEECTRRRNLLRDIMVQAGFRPYSAEWWHYRLADEPYPDTYFDFPIE